MQGFKDLESTSISIEALFTITSSQALSLVINSYLSSAKPKDKTYSPKLTSKYSSPVSTAFFPLIDATIDDSWTLVNVDATQSKKADNAPVLSDLWNKRL